MGCEKLYISIQNAALHHTISATIVQLFAANTVAASYLNLTLTNNGTEADLAER